jgi:hypothetical protein
MQWGILTIGEDSSWTRRPFSSWEMTILYLAQWNKTIYCIRMKVLTELRTSQPILVGFLWKKNNSKAYVDTGFRSLQNQNHFSCRNEICTEMRHPFINKHLSNNITTPSIGGQNIQLPTGKSGGSLRGEVVLHWQHARQLPCSPGFESGTFPV